MKRLFDIVLAIILLIVLSPVLLLIALLVRISSRGPAIFKQERVGLKGKKFTLYKFRTMSVSCPSASTKKLKNREEYITVVGRFLRITSLDELPQLFNILKGEMSFVGPRPVIAREKRLVQERKKRNVYEVKPGVTGLAQIHGRDYLPPIKKARLDARYVHKSSIFIDILIILRTAVMVIRREGILEHSSVPPEEEKKKKKPS